MIGQQVSHYRILGKLGGGGMGVVYEAEDLKLGRHVALKFIPENLTGDPKSLERFEREARAASQLNHPNICTIHGIEDNNGHPFIVMEKLEGQSLKQRIAVQAMETDKVLDIAVQVADARVTRDAGLHHRPVPPRDRNPKLPGELEGTTGRAMEKDRRHRYQSAAEMKSDLQLLKRETEWGW